MNSRLQEFENLITSPDGSIDDVFSKSQRENNQIAQLMTMNPQQAYQLSQDIKNQQDSLDAGLKVMTNQFNESIQQVLKDKPDATKLREYQNVLPYGLRMQPAGTNPQRPALTQDVNDDLENLDHSLTKRLHSVYTNVYHRMFKDTYHELKEEMTENYGNSSVKDIDEECLNHIFSSAVGSMFDWTSIDPKSVGMGSIDHISELFQKYYYGEVNDSGPRPWEEIRSDYRKYGANQHLEIQGDKFYNDFINGFFFRSCVKGYVSKETRAPTDFKSKVEGFYDFNPELWFDNKDPANPTKFKPENKHDSYGNFFKVRQPVRILEAITIVAANDPRIPTNYTPPNPWATAVVNADRQINNYTGMYDTATTDATCTNNYILTNEEKMVCCLFHYAAMRNQEYLAGNLAARLTNPTRPLESLDFDSANQVLFGNGTDAGPNGGPANSALAGQNAPINKAIQLLYNSQSLGFHVTHGQVGGNAGSSTRLVAGGINDIQMITGYSCGVREGANNFVSNGYAGTTAFSTGANAPGNAASVQLFTSLAAGRRPTITDITTAFSKNRYEYIPISQIIRGGSSKYKKQKISKVISKKKLLKKEKKSNPVKKVKKVKKYVQKGGARTNFFDITTQAAQLGTDISLSAKRREETLTKPIFENYRKAIKEYIKKFGRNASATKINDDIQQKLYGIYHLGIFYHDNNKTLDFGGTGGAAPTTGAPNPLRIEQIGEIFLFCSVISNTIKLMIHFFNNIKACINHFINSDLQEIKKGIDKQLKVVNSTNISSFNASYFDKYIDGCTNLIKNIDELVKFLRNNTLCLGKPITEGDSAGAAPAGFTEDEQNILNLFFGANVARQSGSKQAGGLGIGGHNLQTIYPTDFFTFNHSIIDFFSNNGKHDFTHLNTSKFHETLRRLTGYRIELNNGFIPYNATAPNAYPKQDYSITNVSFGGIPFTFQDDKSTQYSWMTYRLLLLWREKSNEKLSDEVVTEINQSLSQISSQDKIDIKKKVIETYKDVRPVLADPKIDLGSKNKILQKVFFSFFENSNTIAKKIIDEHLAIEKKSKRVNVRSKTSISDIVQRRHLGPLESGRVLIPDEIKIQQEMRKFSYKVDCLINLLHVMLIKTHPTIKNYIIFMYSISRLRNFVYRLYYLNKTYYAENEQAKKKLLEESGFSLSKNSKQNTKKTFETFSKLNSIQLKDYNSSSEDWWVAMEKSFRDRTTEIHGIYYRLYTYVLMDGEIYLVDIFSMAKSTHSVKSNKEIMKKDVVIYRDHSGEEIYSPENMFIKPITDLSRDTTYRKLLNGELHYEYTKTGSRDKKKKILEPLFIQGSTFNQLHDIVKDNYYVPAARGRPDTFVASRNPETSFQLYKIQKHFVLHASAFRSWAYQLLFSMPTRIDVDDSFFKLHIQTPINTIPSLAKSQLEPSLKHISYMNQRDPVIEFKSKVRVNNNSKLMLGNNINNKRIESFTKYISREQLIMLGLVFGDTLN
jgi:hypothetical protein